MRGRIVCLAALAATLALLGCGERDAEPSDPRLGLGLDALPEAALCAECHPVVAAKWLRHGMADALGPLDPARLAAATADGAWLEHPPSGFRHRVEARGDGAWILAQERSEPPAGLPPPRREMLLQARIGAGVQDLAFAAVEQGRWHFAPLELLGGAWTHAPFQQGGAGAGLGFRITADCLGCHTDAPLPRPFPAHDLEDLPLRGISCAACHGDASAHIERMRRGEGGAPGALGVLDPALLPPARQLDLCARCHLEGDAKLDLAPHAPFRPGEDLLARRVVLVAREAGEQPPFVSQAQRLALSACFRGSPEMSCTSCHDPHLPPRLEVRERLLGACTQCHDRSAHPSLAEQDGAADCISCHMPRVEPFDLPGARIADHWIRRAPAPQPPGAGFREDEAPDGDWIVFRWRAEDPERHDAARIAALRALARAEHGHAEEAAERLADGLPPGLPAAAHFLRARALAATGRTAAAIAGYETALALDPEHAEAALNRGELLLESGRAAEALEVARALAAAHPRADAPWLLAAAAHAALGQAAEAQRALEQSLARFAAQPEPLLLLGRHARANGDPALALRALFGAWSLDPRLPGLEEELRALR